MRKRLPVVAGLLWLMACQKSDLKVLIGGTAIVAPGAAPVEDSVIVVAGHTIRTVGLRKDVPIPQDSERTDVSGEWIVPAQGGRIAPGEAANLLVLRSAPDGTNRVRPETIARRLKAGAWEDTHR